MTGETNATSESLFLASMPVALCGSTDPHHAHRWSERQEQVRWEPFWCPGHSGSEVVIESGIGGFIESVDSPPSEETR